MRFPVLIALMSLAACSDGQPAASPAAALPNGTYAGAGRDALCVAGDAGAQRAGFIAYGAKDANCSASGPLAPAGAGWTLSPTGDADCRISVSIAGDQVTLRSATPACSYYCGPAATFEDKTFGRRQEGTATDLAGDPLC